MSKSIELMHTLVVGALGKRPEDVAWILNEKSADICLEAKKKFGIVWIGKQKDQLFQFWRLCLGGCFADSTYVIFTDVDDSSLWLDLRAYPGCRFGSLYLLVYSNSSKPAPCPSQRGMLMK